MYIKRITIQGFKTYKNTTTIDNISPHHNVVVGKNGSGKSNFFAAIRFVLSDAYTRMTKEDRQALIHEGSGTVMSAYVEIVFDNTDGKFPTGKEEVVIRRTIGLKKDDYSLDSKSSTRQDVMQLLESAGFSKSNPYYIVPQGKITALTNAKDSERLQLLKEVAGAKIFETKLKESLKEMDASNKKREKIDEMLLFIQERLSDLDDEREELKEYQVCEKDKKAYEFTVYDRELNEITQQLEEVDVEYGNVVDSSATFMHELEMRENTVANLEKLHKQLESQLDLEKIEEKQLAAEVEQLLRVNATKTTSLKMVQDQIQELMEVDYSKMDSEIKDKEQRLEQERPNLTQLMLKETELSAEVDALTSRQRALYSKQGHMAQFSDAAERNQWLQQEIESLDKILADRQSMKLAAEGDVARVQDELNEIAKELEDANDAMEEDADETIVLQLKKQYQQALDSRKLMWREEQRHTAMVSSLENDVSRAESLVNETMDRKQAQGLAAVKRIAQEMNLAGYYGTLGELINVNSKYKTCVDVVGGNSLFHVVVDNDDTATILMEALTRQRAGRVTFMPLNRIQISNVEFPQTSDCVPLLKKIGYDSKYEAAVKHVFGKTVVAIDLVRGSQLAKEYQLSAITLDGDRADRRGVLTGGYHDYKKSRVDCLKTLRKAKQEHNEMKNKLQEIKLKIDGFDVEVNKLNQEIHTKTREYDALVAKNEAHASLIGGLQSRQQTLEKSLDVAQARVAKTEASIASVQSKISALRDEMEQPFTQKLTVQEQDELRRLSESVGNMQNQLNETTRTLAAVSGLMDAIESELTEKLYPQREALRTKALKQQQHIKRLTAEATELELQLNSTELPSMESKLGEIREKIIETENKLKDTWNDLDIANSQQRSLLKKLDNFQRNAEKSMSKKAVLSLRRNEVQRKIREMGILPEEAFSKFEDVSTQELLNRLTEASQKLTQFSHVNKKAIEQYITFTKQRDELMKRRDELDVSRDSIDELIEVLETRKDNAISTTFKEVSKHFAEIFEKLVPQGIGRLVMQTREASQNEDDDEEMAESGEVVENYTGVSISVSFNSKEDEQQKIEQLSGGQKSLCAIALILAIQKADPAPFYLFDEIDAALDAQYRTSVAAMIKELSSTAQFICTTFRPEMLHVADTFYGVMFNNKISTVSEIGRDDALGFIEGQAQRN